MHAGLSFSYSSISVLLKQPLSIKKELCRSDIITDTYIFWNLLCQNFVLFLLYLNKSTSTSTVLVILYSFDRGVPLGVRTLYTAQFCGNLSTKQPYIFIILCDIYIACRFFVTNQHVYCRIVKYTKANSMKSKIDESPLKKIRQI